MNFDISELIETGINENVDQKKMLMILAKANKCGWDELHTFKHLYHEIYDDTLCNNFCSYMVENMSNENEHGRKWTIEQTNDLARKNNIEFDDYSEAEFNTVCHMMYYDYAKDLKESNVSGDSIFAKMADSYLTDPDAPNGKLVHYFFFVEMNK